MVNGMKISIIIPAYNAENRIRQALESVRTQSYTDYELIVVCDSCKDRTKEIAEEYGAITIECKHHCDGPTRNEGLEIAIGDYIMFIDDDDYWLHSEVLSCVVQKLKRSHADVLCCGFIFGYLGYRSPLDNGGYLFPNVWSKVWKRSRIGATRFPNIYSVSDSFFTQEMFNKGLTTELWDSPIYYYNYMRKGSISEVTKNGFDR